VSGIPASGIRADFPQVFSGLRRYTTQKILYAGVDMSDISGVSSATSIAQFMTSHTAQATDLAVSVAVLEQTMDLQEEMMQSIVSLLGIGGNVDVRA
jgi:hypothetical protein